MIGTVDLLRRVVWLDLLCAAAMTDPGLPARLPVGPRVAAMEKRRAELEQQAAQLRGVPK